MTASVVMEARPELNNEEVQKKYDYTRLRDRKKLIMKISKGKNEKIFKLLQDGAQDISQIRINDKDNAYYEELDSEDDCLQHFFECETFIIYEKISKFAKENGIIRVIDIGCAFGHQSETFLQDDIQYIGVTDHISDFWNKDKFQYISDRYPCSLPIKSGDLAVSVLCLTWNCYLIEGEKTLREQCEGLQRDFEHCILYMPKDQVEYVSRYFKEVKVLDDRGLYYFSNK